MEYCPEYDTRCRFCSREHTNRIFERININKITGIYQSAGLGHTIAFLGTMCNQNSQWTRDVVQCPARQGLVHWCGQSADGTGTYAKLIGSMGMKAIMEATNESPLRS